MAEVTLQIGGRNFIVACQDGEEVSLQQAAALLDTEAQALQTAIGRVPETRMLLMAGLMLADRTAELAEQAVQSQSALERLNTQFTALESKASNMAAQASGTSREELDAAMSVLEAAADRADRLAGG